MPWRAHSFSMRSAAVMSGTTVTARRWSGAVDARVRQPFEHARVHRLGQHDGRVPAAGRPVVGRDGERLGNVRVVTLDRLEDHDDRGITTTGSHAPLVNLVIATIINTTKVATAPTPLSHAFHRHPSTGWRK